MKQVPNDKSFAIHPSSIHLSIMACYGCCFNLAFSSMELCGVKALEEHATYNQTFAHIHE